MRSIAILSLMFFHLFIKVGKSDYISIEYVGDADKPLNVIYISKEPIPRSELIVTIPYDDLPMNYIINNNEFLFVKDEITSTSKKLFENKDYNGFKITIKENNSLISYFISRKKSNSLFIKTINFLKKGKENKELISNLNTLCRTNVF